MSTRPIRQIGKFTDEMVRRILEAQRKLDAFVEPQDCTREDIRVKEDAVIATTDRAGTPQERNLSDTAEWARQEWFISDVAVSSKTPTKITFASLTDASGVALPTNIANAWVSIDVAKTDRGGHVTQIDLDGFWIAKSKRGSGDGLFNIRITQVVIT
jgi:hypothetical protein